VAVVVLVLVLLLPLLLLLLGLYPAGVPNVMIAARQLQHKGRTSKNRGQ